MARPDLSCRRRSPGSIRAGQPGNCLQEMKEIKNQEDKAQIFFLLGNL
jgi:hypothetical protein